MELRVIEDIEKGTLQVVLQAEYDDGWRLEDLEAITVPLPRTRVHITTYTVVLARRKKEAPCDEG